MAQRSPDVLTTDFAPQSAVAGTVGALALGSGSKILETFAYRDGGELAARPTVDPLPPLEAPITSS
jgi:hypothetical protein